MFPAILLGKASAGGAKGAGVPVRSVGARNFNPGGVPSAGKTK